MAVKHKRKALQDIAANIRRLHNAPHLGRGSDSCERRFDGADEAGRNLCGVRLGCIKSDGVLIFHPRIRLKLNCDKCHRQRLPCPSGLMHEAGEQRTAIGENLLTRDQLNLAGVYARDASAHLS